MTVAHQFIASITLVTVGFSDSLSVTTTSHQTFINFCLELHDVSWVIDKI